MIKKIIAFVGEKKKSFLIADAACSALAVAFLVNPGAFFGPWLGIPGLVGAVLITAAVVASMIVKVEDEKKV
jgi:hypothetical protein